MAFIHDPQIENTFKCQVEFYYDSRKFKENNLSQCLQNLNSKKLDVNTIFIFATSSIATGSSQTKVVPVV